ncbi:hypothetical protein [Arthrobacter sp. SO3]|uniref:hypothetical protein n=1 Tax=Arthrobacter sp. SO3 TaxID=1897057 RepID=UPI001CFFB999|nr:hypothetical protein [Arthrobacter sp. SO3]MCB5290803.1 hypothetical protein [Arthrobacter sp. SO3]
MAPSASFGRTSDISFPVGDLDGVLHARSIILGLNPGESAVERSPWQNFHTSPRHNHHFLAEAFRGTPHWGAYMTDLLAEVNSKSNTLDLSDKTIHRDVVVLVEQFQALGAADPLVIVVGKKTAKAFKKYEPVLAAALGLPSVRWGPCLTTRQRAVGFTGTTPIGIDGLSLKRWRMLTALFWPPKSLLSGPFPWRILGRLVSNLVLAQRSVHANDLHLFWVDAASARH